MKPRHNGGAEENGGIRLSYKKLSHESEQLELKSDQESAAFVSMKGQTEEIPQGRYLSFQNDSPPTQGRDSTKHTNVEVDSSEIALESTARFLEYDADEHGLQYEMGFDDPSCPPTQGCNKPYLQWKSRRFVEHFLVRLFTTVLIVVDMIVLIADLFNDPQHQKNDPLEYCSVTFSTYFMVEVSLRLFALGPYYYFRMWYNILDLAVVVITFILSIATVCLDHLESSPANLLVTLRFVRLLRVIRIIWQQRHLKTGARQFISQNKRRYQKNGFDLDLTYITPRVIAMSFPSSGKMSLYRNDIKEVARFFNTIHKNHYKLYNLCAERHYDATLFNNQVERFLISDHNVPTLKEMLRFSKSSREWLSEDKDNVIAVHCKGGKGRTGTMICVTLIDSNLFEDAAHCLGFFGERRTDKNAGRKFQGVETPSQSRFVQYYESLLACGRNLPRENRLIIRGFTISCMKYIGNGDASEFSISIQARHHDEPFMATVANSHNCKATRLADDEIYIEIIKSPLVKAETKVMFLSSSKKIPRGYENCPFYFWFHTSFIKNNMLVLSRSEIDNPHKSKTWNVFRENFQVTVHFAAYRGPNAH